MNDNTGTVFFLSSSLAIAMTTQVATLHKDIGPHLLRRVVKDVEKSLPPKIERILRVEMSPMQRNIYTAILKRNFAELNKGVKGGHTSLLNIVVELKKCCNHPFLFESFHTRYGKSAVADDNDGCGSIRREREQVCACVPLFFQKKNPFIH